MSDLSEYRHYLGILAWTDAEKKKLKERMKELEAAEEEAYEQITEALGFDTDEEDGTHFGTIKGKKVVKYVQSHQNRLDQSVLEERYPKVLEECRRKKTYHHLEVL